ncbi:MAG: leucine-rich repeat domain-containing protein [Clostridia bacterium]|nr:leucine-rich repeat domain-containing protein [Clostridia bacterium]
MKNRIIYLALSLVLVLALAVGLSSCDLIGGATGGSDLSGISFKDKTVTYDGSTHAIEISGELPEGVTVEYENNNQQNAGKYTVVAKFYKDGEYLEGEDKTATLRINKASLADAMSAVSLEGKTVTYNGEAHSILLSGALPEGVAVEYTGNGQTEVGVYTVVAKFTVDTDNYYPVADMSAVLVIEAAEEVIPEIDLSGISFEGKTVTYNGEVHSLAISGTLPEGVTVEYVGNDKSDAGTHIVEAKFFYNGVHLEDDNKRATLRIEKAVIDMSGIGFEGAVVLYTGEAQSLKISGSLPEGVTVDYVGNGQIAAGTYTVTAKFTVDRNYKAIPDMTASLTILGSEYALSRIELPEKTVVYDGTEFKLFIDGGLPENISVEYGNNGHTDAGSYIVTAKFYYKGEYISGADKSASLIIEKATVDMSGVSFEDKVFDYDKEAHTITVSGDLPKGVTVEYDGNVQTNIGSYIVTAKFTYVDAKNYNPIPDMTANLKITFDGQSELDSIVFEGKTVVYNKEAHSLAIEGSLPFGVKVEYENNAQTEAGSYTVVAKFYYAGDYIEGADRSATLKIDKADVDMSGVVFESAEYIYDGEVHSLVIGGTLPEGVSVTFIGNDHAEVGNYTVIARFTYVDAKNYNAIPQMMASLVITPDPTTLYGVTFEDASFTYNGEAHSLAVGGASYDGITVEYVGNGQVTVGSYVVVAKFFYKGEYITGADKSATLTIVHKDSVFDGVSFEGKTVTYNGSEHSLSVEGTLPEGYTVLEYVGNGAVNAGSYSVTVKFAYNGAHDASRDMVATLTVAPAELPVIDVKDQTVNFDGKNHSIDFEVAGLPEGVSIIKVGRADYLPGTYKFTFRYSLSGAAIGNYTVGDDVTVILTINNYSETYSTAGLVFLSVSGGYAVDGYNGTDEVVVIPSSYAGRAVVAISSVAFRNNSVVKSVIVPDSVTAIGQGAFLGTQLEEIKLPFIGGSKVSSNKYLGYIFGASSYVANETFVPVTLKRVILSDACTLIPAYSFRGCVSLEEVVIGSGVTEIGISAFEKCTSLGAIYIPKTVTSIPAAANYYNSPFFDCGESFKIYLEAESVPASGYGAMWNKLSKDSAATVILGVSYEEYVALKNA